MDGPELNPEDIFKPNMAAEIDSSRTWVDPNGYRLSDRLWRTKAADRAQVDTILRKGLAAGKSPLTVAREVTHLLHPDQQPRRNPETFQMLPQSKQAPGVTTTTPRQGSGVGFQRPRNSGQGSYAARRLARTETTQAFGDAAKKAARANPLLERMKWRKSAHHHEPDVCDQNASRSSKGQPPGVYFHDELPQYTAHPHEMCTIGPYVTQDDVDFAIPRLREYIRTGNLPSRSWGELMHRSGTKVPLLPEAPVPQTTAPAAVDDDLANLSPNELYRRDLDDLRARFDATTDPRLKEQIAGQAGKRVRQYMRDNDLIDTAHEQALHDWGRSKKAEAAAQKAFLAQNKKLYSPRMQMTTDDALFTREAAKWDKLRAARDAATKTHYDNTLRLQQHGGNPYGDASREALSRARPMATWEQPHIHTVDSMDDAVYALNEARQSIPAEWWSQSVAAGPIKSRVLERAFHRRAYGEAPAEINVSGDYLYQAEVAVHEFVHRAESLRPGIVQAELGFYARRVGTEKLKQLPRSEGYEVGEKARLDDFNTPYIGKDYGGRAWEVMTMGTQHVMMSASKVPTYIAGDEDYLEFVLGVLAIG